jgi:16S rRNA (cytosine1402-N4)-methyltransferase
VTASEFGHVPVLSEPCIRLLKPQPGGRFIDCTINGGGHAQAILEQTAPDGRLLGLDADADALGAAASRLAPFGRRLTLTHSNFRDLGAAATEAHFTDVDGILMDLGLSSRQLGAAERGFAFSLDGPLDMRFDTSEGRSAADLIAAEPASEIERILREYGEEPRARRVAEAIAAARQRAAISTTRQLADLVAAAIGRGSGRIHPATRTFQALRIAVNDELGALRAGLPQAVTLLRRGGRLAVIAFHSLEDRIVKTFFSASTGKIADDPRLPTPPSAPEALLTIVTRRPVMASPEEIAANPRSRSARLRVAERL